MPEPELTQHLLAAALKDNSIIIKEMKTWETMAQKGHCLRNYGMKWWNGEQN